MPQALSIKALVHGDVHRLRYVTRYSTSLVLQRENVAEHSYYVSLYAMFICRYVNSGPLESRCLPIDELEVLQRCLLHDLDESRTGDFQRPFKHRNKQFKEMIEHQATAEFSEAVSGIFPGDEEYVREATYTWINAKDDTKEGRIVAFADFLSVISHLYGETACGNFSVMREYKSLYEYIRKFDSPDFDFLRPLVDETISLFDEMIDLSGQRENVNNFALLLAERNR